MIYTSLEDFLLCCQTGKESLIKSENKNQTIFHFLFEQQVNC